MEKLTVRECVFTAKPFTAKPAQKQMCVFDFSLRTLPDREQLLASGWHPAFPNRADDESDIHPGSFWTKRDPENIMDLETPEFRMENPDGWCGELPRLRVVWGTQGHHPIHVWQETHRIVVDNDGEWMEDFIDCYGVLDRGPVGWGGPCWERLRQRLAQDQALELLFISAGPVALQLDVVRYIAKFLDPVRDAMGPSVFAAAARQGQKQSFTDLGGKFLRVLLNYNDTFDESPGNHFDVCLNVVPEKEEEDGFRVRATLGYHRVNENGKVEQEGRLLRSGLCGIGARWIDRKACESQGHHPGEKLQPALAPTVESNRFVGQQLKNFFEGMGFSVTNFLVTERDRVTLDVVGEDGQFVKTTLPGCEFRFQYRPDADAVIKRNVKVNSFP